MKSALFVLGLALCCVAQANQIERFENMDHSQLNGDWFAVAMVTDCGMMKKMLPGMKASPVHFEQLSEDQIKMSMVIPMPDGECKAINPMLKRENGVFITKCKKGGKKTVEYGSLNGNAMSSSITFSHKKKGQCTMSTLAVRNLEDTEASLEGFRAFVKEVGPKDEEVHVLPTEGMCQHSS